MPGKIRLAATAVIAAAGVVAIASSADAQPYHRGYGPGLVTSDVYLPYGGYYGSGSTGPFSGPFRTDSSPMAFGGN
jgi:hypothetical protein